MQDLEALEVLHVLDPKHGYLDTMLGEYVALELHVGGILSKLRECMRNSSRLALSTDLMMFQDEDSSNTTPNYQDRKFKDLRLVY